MTSASVDSTPRPASASVRASGDASAQPAARSHVPDSVTGGRVRITQRRSVALLMAATVAVSTVVFPPLSWWPVAYVFLAPWLVVVCTCETSRWVYVGSWLMGVAFFGFHTWWLCDVTAPGYAALCLWFALAFPLAAWPVRNMFRRLRASVALMFPLAWVALEYLRGQTLVGFPWLYVAHSHYKFLTMIQVCDFTGAYGLSFVIAMVNGWLTDLLIQPFKLQGRRGAADAVRLPIGTAATLLVVASAFVYGRIRLAESAQTRLPGPRVAIVQGDFPCTISEREPNQVHPVLALETHINLADQAAADHPDLIVMPETVWSSPLNREFIQSQDLEPIRVRAYPPTYRSSDMLVVQRFCRDADQMIRDLARRSGAALVVGAQATEWRPTEIPERVRRFNSVYVYPPTGREYIGRYDKMHLVLFGEFVPFRYSSLHSVYQWLNGITPWGGQGREYSLDFGEEARRFEAPAPSQGGRKYRFATPVCYEDVVSGVIRAFVTGPDGGKQVDFLLNVSNDGWFHHSAELEQHLAACVFRAVEFRVPIARSVNTGVSVFIDSSGHMHNKIRLSNEQTRRFAALRDVLTELAQHADRFARQGAVDNENAEDRQVRENIRALLRERLPAAIVAMPSLGPSAATSSAPANSRFPLLNEYDYLRHRLLGLFNRAITSPRQDEPEAWRAFAAQLHADLQTLDQWSDKTQTAPGYRVAEMVCDARHSFYARWGDWFALCCVAATAGMLLDWTIRRLRRPSRRQRRRAARAAAAAAAGAACLAGLASAGCSAPTEAVRLTAQERTSLERQSLMTLSAAALDDSAAVRVRALEAMQTVAPREGAAFFREMLSDEYAGVRFAALMAVGTAKQPDCLETVRRMADDPDPRVRPAALYALHRLGDTRRTTELAKLLLTHPRAEVRANAALVFGRLGQKNAIDVLKGAMKDRDEAVRLQVLESMLLLGSDAARRDLLALAYHAVGQKTVFVLQALGRAHRTDAKSFCEYYASPEEVHDEVRLAAAATLAQLGDRRGLAFALNRLMHYRPHHVDPSDTPEQQAVRVRVLACVALECIGDPAALGALRQVLSNDPDASVRVAAARAALAILRRS